MQDTAIAQFLRLAPFLPDLPKGVIDAMPTLETPLQAAYVIATFLPGNSFQQQQVLEAATVEEKFTILTTFLTQELTRREKGKQKPIENQTAHESTQQANPSPAWQQKRLGGVVLAKD